MTTFRTSRSIPATVERVFAAFEPARLAKWWGPAGFTNTFKVCEFKSGGRWSFIMHGPNGADYANENVFDEVLAPTKVVIRHVSEPRFSLTITLENLGGETVVHWAQALEDSEVAERIRHIVVPANEENLDRMAAEVLRG